MEFIETTTFTRLISDLVGDDEYAKFQKELSDDPEKGDVMPKCGGVRKVRIATEGRGKSGGARVIYYYLRNHSTIYLLYVFTKGDADNLSSEGKKKMREYTRAIKAEYHE